MFSWCKKSYKYTEDGCIICWDPPKTKDSTRTKCCDQICHVCCLEQWYSRSNACPHCEQPRSTLIPCSSAAKIVFNHSTCIYQACGSAPVEIHYSHITDVRQHDDSDVSLRFTPEWGVSPLIIPTDNPANMRKIIRTMRYYTEK